MVEQERKRHEAGNAVLKVQLSQICRLLNLSQPGAFPEASAGARLHSDMWLHWFGLLV